MDIAANPSPTVQVEFTLAVGAGRLEASLPVPAGTVNVTQLLPVLQTLTSNIVNSAAQIANAEGYQISCRAGCGACCRQMVPLSLFEAEFLAEWIRSLPQEQQLALEQRFHATLLALGRTGILEHLDPATWVDGSPEAKVVVIDYLALKIPCPFLVEESCSIHPIRPLICREYLVTSPAEFCAEPSAHPVIAVPIPLKASTVLYNIAAEVDRSTQGWIPLVFLFAWMKSGAQPGRAIAGPGPELLYEIVKRLAS